MIPYILMFTSERNFAFSKLTWTGIVIWGLGLLIESVADQQKFKFKSKAKNKKKWIQTGLWRYSRHPNYFGEITLWWGLFLVALPYLKGWAFLGIVGPMFITFILLFVSGIPPLEKRYQKKYGKNKKYQKYVRDTSLLLPLPPG